jgi:hypothetical protein
VGTRFAVVNNQKIVAYADIVLVHMDASLARAKTAEGQDYTILEDDAFVLCTSTPLSYEESLKFSKDSFWKATLSRIEEGQKTKQAKTFFKRVDANTLSTIENMVLQKFMPTNFKKDDSTEDVAALFKSIIMSKEELAKEISKCVVEFNEENNSEENNSEENNIEEFVSTVSDICIANKDKVKEIPFEHGKSINFGHKSKYDDIYFVFKQGRFSEKISVVISSGKSITEEILSPINKKDEKHHIYCLPSGKIVRGKKTRLILTVREDRRDSNDSHDDHKIFQFNWVNSPQDLATTSCKHSFAREEGYFSWYLGINANKLLKNHNNVDESEFIKKQIDTIEETEAIQATIQSNAQEFNIKMESTQNKKEKEQK